MIRRTLGRTPNWAAKRHASRTAFPESDVPRTGTSTFPAAGGGGLGWLAAFIPALVLVVGLAVWSRFK